MEIIGKGLLLTAATALVSYGVTILQTDFNKAVIALVLGLVLYVAREVLKKNGYDIGATLGSKKRK